MWENDKTSGKEVKFTLVKIFRKVFMSVEIGEKQPVAVIDYPLIFSRGSASGVSFLYKQLYTQIIRT